MKTLPASLSGGCFCGDIRFAAASPPSFVCICHCRSCRRAAGAPMVAWATFAVSDVHLERGSLQQLASSPGVLRGYCARCGTSVSYRNERRPAEIDLTVASLDDAAEYAPTAHIWVEDKLPWAIIDDALPQYPRTAGEEEA